ncbi:hypothetical protein ACWGI9_28585 [Streptomyces sp. NPDC054833]
MTAEPGAAPAAATGFDHVVIGAGAGGGPLAANLAAAGMRTLLLDAGGAEENDNYLVPAFHADASNDARHGFDGWLPTALADPELAIQDKQLLKVILSAAQDTLADLLDRPLSPLEGLGSFVDPNDWRAQTMRCRACGGSRSPRRTDGAAPCASASGRRSAATPAIWWCGRTSWRRASCSTRTARRPGSTTSTGHTSTGPTPPPGRSPERRCRAGSSPPAR